MPAELNLTLKADEGAPWLTIRGGVDEQSQAISELSQRNAWPVICQAARDFSRAWREAHAKPSHDQAVATVVETLPGSQVVQDAQTLPDSLHVTCSQCGQRAVHKKGVSRQGTPYDGYYCPQWHKAK